MVVSQSDQPIAYFIVFSVKLTLEVIAGLVDAKSIAGFSDAYTSFFTAFLVISCLRDGHTTLFKRI